MPILHPITDIPGFESAKYINIKNIWQPLNELTKLPEEFWTKAPTWRRMSYGDSYRVVTVNILQYHKSFISSDFDKLAIPHMHKLHPEWSVNSITDHFDIYQFDDRFYFSTKHQSWCDIWRIKIDPCDLAKRKIDCKNPACYKVCEHTAKEYYNIVEEDIEKLSAVRNKWNKLRYEARKKNDIVRKERAQRRYLKEAKCFQGKVAISLKLKEIQDDIERLLTLFEEKIYVQPGDLKSFNKELRKLIKLNANYFRSLVE